MSNSGKRPLHPLAKRARKVPLIVRLPIILIAVAIPLYWIITGTGIYYEVAMFQAKFLDGEHYLFISASLAILTTLAPAAVLVQLLAGLYPDEDEPGLE